MKRNIFTHLLAFALGALAMYIALWVWAGYTVIQAFKLIVQ